MAVAGREIDSMTDPNALISGEAEGRLDSLQGRHWVMMDYDDDPSRYQIDFVGGETRRRLWYSPASCDLASNRRPSFTTLAGQTRRNAGRGSRAAKWAFAVSVLLSPLPWKTKQNRRDGIGIVGITSSCSLLYTTRVVCTATVTATTTATSPSGRCTPSGEKKRHVTTQTPVPDLRHAALGPLELVRNRPPASRDAAGHGVATLADQEAQQPVPGRRRLGWPALERHMGRRSRESR